MHGSVHTCIGSRLKGKVVVFVDTMFSPASSTYVAVLLQILCIPAPFNFQSSRATMSRRPFVILSLSAPSSLPSTPPSSGALLFPCASLCVFRHNLRRDALLQPSILTFVTIESDRLISLPSSWRRINPLHR